MPILKARSVPRRVASLSKTIAASVAAAVLLAMIAPGITQAATAPTASTAPSNSINISVTRSTAGFVHPGIGVSADDLASTREHLIHGDQPWTGYYEAMLKTGYASPTVSSANAGPGVDQPAQNGYNSLTSQNQLIGDSWRAYTQGLLYYLTGDITYRVNALHIVRTWSHMDPTKVADFTDAKIHTGEPLYRLIAAAELLRATPADASAGDYNADWTDQDTANLVTNMIKPVTDVILYKNTNYMNQHSYPLVGAMAGYIFSDNRARYNESVEWFTMNSTTTQPDINGALVPIFPLIDKDNTANHYGYSFVQHQEMSRDQAHAGDDVDTLTVLARMVTVQGTKLDRKTGTVSNTPNAVDAYKFYDNRLLAGANAYAQFMLGNDTPFIDTTGHGATLSNAYRGRLDAVGPSLQELYNVYSYNEGIDVGKVAPYLAQAAAQENGPLFYSGPTLTNFWGAADGDIGTWLSIPDQVKGQVPPAADPNVQFEQKSVKIDGKVDVLNEGGVGFARLRADDKGSTVALHDVTYVSRTGYSPVGLRIRTTAVSTLEVSKDQHSQPFQTVTLPNTHGEWRYITYDMDSSNVPVSNTGDNIVFYTAKAPQTTNVDLDLLNVQAKSQLSPPLFKDGPRATVVTFPGAATSRTLTASDSNTSDTLSYEINTLPAGATFEAASGTVSWTPTTEQVGTTNLVVTATDGTTDTTLNLAIVVAKDRQSALADAQAGYDSTKVYTSDTLAAFNAAVAQAQQGITSMSDSDFLAALVKVQAAVQRLQLLNPRLPDGTLDYSGIVRASIPGTAVDNLVDGDNTTFSGDLTTPIVLDFGIGYQVSAKGFGLQARYAFANRSMGASVYGSNDDQQWTLLTSRQTTDTTSSNYAMEMIPVLQGQQDPRYRFIKIQVDNPGSSSDPTFPGLSSFSEFRIDGQRSETVNRITSATIASSGPVSDIAGEGDTVKLSIATSETVSDLAASIEGIPATISGGGQSWTASIVLPAGAAVGRNTRFKVDYKTASGQQATPLEMTTDWSAVYLSTNAGLLGNPLGHSTLVSLTGQPEPTKLPDVTKAFDGNPATYSDTHAVNGAYYAVMDFGAGSQIRIDRADLLVRQDSYGSSRAPGLHLEGSNDLATWTVLTNNATTTLDWQNLAGKGVTGSFRYLKIANNTFIDIAELRLFGGMTTTSKVTAASISSSNAIKTLAGVGDTISLSFTTSEPVSNVAARIEGNQAKASSSDGEHWTASAIVPPGAATGRTAQFKVDYTTASGAQAKSLVATTDGSSVYLSTGANLMANPLASSTLVSLTGTPEPTKQPDIAKAFDDNATTYTDTHAVNGAYYAVLDFGPGKAITVQQADLLVRQDSYGTSRASNLQLQGSNDLSTWTPLTGNAKATLAWQNLVGTSTGTGYRYLKIANTTYINIAELRLFGTVTP